jgi:hypothetical protein
MMIREVRMNGTGMRERRWMARLAAGAAVTFACAAVAAPTFAATTVTLPPLGAPVGSSCSSTDARIGGGLALPRALATLPLPLAVGDNLSNLTGGLGGTCANVPAGSSASGIWSSASTAFNDNGQLAMTNTATNTSSEGSLVSDVAYTSGAQDMIASLVPPLAADSETLSVTLNYHVLGVSFQPASYPPDLLVDAWLPASCVGANAPQETFVGDPNSLALGAHSITITFTCPTGYPLQAPSLSFGMYEDQEIVDPQGSWSSYVAVAWDGGTLTVGP